MIWANKKAFIFLQENWMINVLHPSICCGVVVITTAQLHSSKPKLRFCAGLNPAYGMSEIRDGEDLWQWSRLEIKIRLSSVNHTTKQFIISVEIICFERLQQKSYEKLNSGIFLQKYWQPNASQVATIWLFRR